MIARPHICSRCRSLLARGSTPLNTRAASQSTGSRPHGSTTLPDDLDDEETLHAPIKRPLKLSRRPLGSRKLLSEFPLGKLYGYTGQQLRENRETLPIDMLGEATEVIVLRDSKINKHRQSYKEDVETKERIDILAKLDEERGLVGWEEVQENINEFRPSADGRPQTREQFSGLLTELQCGFTASQLARYLDTHGQKNVSTHPMTAQYFVWTSPWIPGTSDSDQRLDNDNLGGYDLRFYTPKQRLALRILRECWKLELEDVEEGIGQIEVELKPEDLDLLLKGSATSLSSIHSTYILSKEERLETFRSNDAKRSRNAIRITCTRTKSYLIVQEIEQILKGINRTQFPLKALMSPAKEGDQGDFRKWVDVHFDESVVEELARLTKTDIKKTPEGSLSIDAIDHPPTEGPSKTDLVRRLVVTSGNFSGRETSWLGSKDIPNATLGVLVNYPLTEGLPWRDRLRQWTRWVTPVSRDTGANDTLDQTLQEWEQTREETGEGTGQLISPTQEQSETRDDSGLASQLPPSDKETESQNTKTPSAPGIGWSTDLTIHSSALLGSVIFNQPETYSLGDSRTDSFIANAVRSFPTSVPNITQILATCVSSRRAPIQAFVLKLEPNPFALSPSSKQPLGSAALRAFPPIEMRFNPHPRSTDLKLNQICAIISTENSDFMLPHAATDLRFQQRISSRLHSPRRDLPKEILDFLDASSLSLDYSNGPITTPSSLEIPIPSFLCDPLNVEMLGAAYKDAETHNVEYIFSGYEVRKIIPMTFEGWQLLYTSVEAGKAGGKRGELRLRPQRTVKSDDPALETEEAFLTSAHRLADFSQSLSQTRKVEKKFDDGFGAFNRRPQIDFWTPRVVADENGEEVLVDEFGYAIHDEEADEAQEDEK